MRYRLRLFPCDNALLLMCIISQIDDIEQAF
nr:MAG TPA: hypothetical protein [Caudoviricetes sp.]